jgi:enoyl-CoA hydratase/carnithine racemase
MASLSDELFSAPDAAEGMAAFAEKRRPSWVAPWVAPRVPS